MFMPKIIFDMPLNHREITVYRCLCDKANKKGECYPSARTIAKELKISSRTVFRALNGLEQKRLITRRNRVRNNGGTSSNIYKLGVM